MSLIPTRLAQRKRQRFLKALARTGNVTAACGMARLPRETAYFWRSRDPDFSLAWDEALERGLDALEDEAMRRAKDGVPEPVFYQGRVVGETRRYSDVLAMFILKSKRREVWGERQQIDVQHDWTQFSEEERVRRALELIDLAKGAIEKKRLLELGPSKIVYDPTDGDELAEQEAQRRRQEEQSEGSGDSAGCDAAIRPRRRSL